MDKSFQSDPSVYFTSFTKTIYSPMAVALATALEQKALKFSFWDLWKQKLSQVWNNRTPVESFFSMFKMYVFAIKKQCFVNQSGCLGCFWQWSIIFNCCLSKNYSLMNFYIKGCSSTWPADEAYKYNKVNSIIPTLAHSFSCLRAVCVNLKYSFPMRQRSYYFGGGCRGGGVG